MGMVVLHGGGGVCCEQCKVDGACRCVVYWLAAVMQQSSVLMCGIQ